MKFTVLFALELTTKEFKKESSVLVVTMGMQIRRAEWIPVDAS